MIPPHVNAPITFQSKGYQQSLLDGLTTLTGLESGRIIQMFGENQLLEAAKLLEIKPTKPVQKYSRLILGPVLAAIPAKQRLVLSDLLKLIRNPSKEVASLDPLAGPGNTLIQKLNGHYRSDSYAPGKRFWIALSHDVDTIVGYRFIPRMMKDLTDRGLRSSFYFLTHADYKLDKGLLDELESAGFEIGLHGKTHDLGIAYRSRSHIRSWLTRARDILGRPKPGFRSPGLSISHVLMEELSRLGFAYDSSQQYGSSFYPSTGFSLPYRHPGLGLMEFPIWFQDAFLFRDGNMSCADALTWCRDMICHQKETGVGTVLLLHPDIMVHKQDFWRGFLDFISDLEQHDAFVCPLKKVIGFFDNGKAEA